MKKLLLLLCIGVSASVASQTHSVRVQGTVTSDVTGDPVFQCLVSLKCDSMEVNSMTDFDGNYLLTNVPSGTYTIELNGGINYTKKTITGIAVSGRSDTTINFTLGEQEGVLDAVVVVGRMSMITRGNTTTSTCISSEQIVGLAARNSRATSEQIQNNGRPRELVNDRYNSNPKSRFHSTEYGEPSTFSMDVDKASFYNVKSLIESSRNIPTDAVRTEEFLNSFYYHLPEPEGEEVFSVETELTASPWNEERLLLRIGVATQQVIVSDLPPANLVFLVDVSGSMQGSDRLGLIQTGLNMLVQQLRPQDKVAIVTYAGYSATVLEPTSGNEKDEIISAINSLSAGGSTNGAGGIERAYALSSEMFESGSSNRVILLTDGDFNVGVNSQSDLISLIEEKRETGVFLSVVGFGRGNYNEGTMEQLADHGNGNFNYAGNTYDAQRIFVEEMGGNLFTVAKDGKVQVEFNPMLVKEYRLIGYENRILSEEDFDNDAVDAGDIGMGMQVTAVYEVIPGEASRRNRRRYSEMHSTNQTSELCNVAIRYKSPEGDTSVRRDHAVMNEVSATPSATQNFVTAVVGFASLLREDDEIQMSTHQIAEMARSGIEDDPKNQRSDFIQLVQLYRNLNASAE